MHAGVTATAGFNQLVAGHELKRRSKIPEVDTIGTGAIPVRCQSTYQRQQFLAQVRTRVDRHTVSSRCFNPRPNRQGPRRIPATDNEEIGQILFKPPHHIHTVIKTCGKGVRHPRSDKQRSATPLRCSVCQAANLSHHQCDDGNLIRRARFAAHPPTEQHRVADIVQLKPIHVVAVANLLNDFELASAHRLV